MILNSVVRYCETAPDDLDLQWGQRFPPRFAGPAGRDYPLHILPVAGGLALTFTPVHLRELIILKA